MGALHGLVGFLGALTNADADGRIILHPAAGAAKFVLLNAASHFRKVPRMSCDLYYHLCSWPTWPFSRHRRSDELVESGAAHDRCVGKRLVPIWLLAQPASFTRQMQDRI